MSSARYALVVQAAVLKNRLAEVLTETGASFASFADPRELPADLAPDAIVVELELPGAIEAVSEWKGRWPSCFIAGALSMPRQDLWNAGRAAGCTFVANSGSMPRQIRRRLEETAGSGRLAVPRLKVLLSPRPGNGLVGMLPDAPDGPIAVFRAEGRLYAILEGCPHAGASLADGDLKGTIVTCPQHGSQFDVCNGKRVRGPSDFPVRTYPVVEDGGDVYVELV